MLSFLVDSPADGPERDLLIERLWSAGTIGIVEGETTLEVYFEDGYDAALISDLNPRKVEHEDIDWVAETKRSFPAMPVGDRFFLAPPWSDDPTPNGRLRLVVNPGQAHGTGQHPCSQLCLRALERHVQPGMDVLDVGAGSGILSIAAGLLGAKRVVACDIDAESVEHCEANLKFVGSVDGVGSAAFDVAISNIGPAVNRALLPEFWRVLRPGGIAILSGYESPLGLPGTVEILEQDGWVCEVLVRPEL